jgi:hypothetical protein
MDDMIQGITSLSYSPDVLTDFISFFTPLSFPEDVDLDIEITFFIDKESDILWDHNFSSPLLISLLLDADHSFAFKAYNRPRKFIDLSKEPLSYMETMACPDADAW